jgi:hypothetical protein
VSLADPTGLKGHIYSEDSVLEESVMGKAFNPTICKVSLLTPVQRLFRNRCARVRGIHVLLIVMASALSWPAASFADHDELPNFGYRELGSPTMPLLTILLDFTDGNFSPDHDPEFYERLLFAGGLTGRLAGTGSFYAEQSTDEFGLGAFTFENVGVLGPFPHPDDPLTPGDEQNFACARGMDSAGNPLPPAGPPGSTIPVAQCGFWRWNARSTPPQWDNLGLHETLTNAIIAANTAGFPFGDFDSNGDGSVDKNELAILVIFAPSPGFGSRGGAVRNTSVAPLVLDRSGTQVNLPVAVVGEDASATTVVHELAHVLQGRVGGTYEGYGSGGRCLNGKFTTMSCTIVPAADDRDIYHLDPYTKMRFGFLQPDVAHLSDSLCLTMSPIEDEPGPDTRSLILYDPDRGPNEYFIVEYRRPLLFNYDGDPFGTGSFGLPDKGLGIWYVQVGADGSPAGIAALDGSGGQDAALLLVPPRFAANSARWGQESANNGLWGSEDGAAVLTWPDGTSTGTELRVLREQNSKLFLQVAQTGGPTCLNIPKPSLTEFLRIADGIDHWDNGLFNVTRRIDTPIVSGKQFNVEYTLVANQDVGSIIVVSDNFSGDFVPVPGQKPSLTFPQLVQGQPVTLNYSMLAGDTNGGFELLTEVALPIVSDNPQNPPTTETYTISSFISVWNPNEVLDGDNEENDSDGDDIFDGGDNCPNENAYGLDSDRDGCIDTLADIADVVEKLYSNGDINKGISNSLLSKIRNAEKDVSKGHYLEAIAKLQDFMGEVHALEIKKIPEYEVFLMRSYADVIQSHLASLNNEMH